MQAAASQPTVQTHKIDLSTPRRVHVVGAGGTGMSAIATVLLAMGHEVTGSDATASVALDRVHAAGAKVWTGQRPELIGPNTDVLVRSTAVPDTDAEVEAAIEREIPVLRRADMLASIAAVKRTVAVAGTHGKTTTSTMLALALEAAGADPSWIIGAEILGRGNGANWSEGDWFVVEADESDGTFLELGAEAAIVTNIEPDHLEHYGGWPQLQAAFERFCTSISGPLVMLADDPVSASLAVKAGAVTFSFDAATDADFHIDIREESRFDVRFTMTRDADDVQWDVTLPIPGKHNVANAAAALVLAAELGADPLLAIRGVESFSGVHRRFQPRGEKGGIVFVDDYAHLPSEVKAALSAARGGGWNRVVAVFQPHRYSRTEQVGRDFAGAFDGVDHLVLADVYAAGEQPRPGIDGGLVRDAVANRDGHPPITYVPDRTHLAAMVLEHLEPGDLCITLGAGDVTGLADEIQALIP